MTDALPLNGMRVIDLTVEVGELAARLLADLGADVVKVEAPGGSRSRSLPPFAPDGTSLWWHYRNANKRGAVINLDTGTGRARFDELLATADVVIDSTPRVASLVARHPRLVGAAITWFGLTGDYANWVATDDVIVGMAGWLSTAGPSTRPPVLVPGSVASDAAGVMGAFAVLCALWQRRLTGRGQLLDVSAFEAAIQIDSWGLPNASAIKAAGMDARRIRSAEKGIYPCIQVRDGWVRLVLIAPRHWRVMFDWIGAPPAFADPFWEKAPNRFANTDVLNPVLEAFFADMTMQEATVEAQRRGVVITPVSPPSALVRDEHFRSRGTFADAEIAPGIRAPVATGFFEFDGSRAGFREPAPVLGDRAGAAPARAPAADGGASPSDRPAPGRGPLAGLCVIDFGHGGVGVQAGRMLAENGADVIKIESRSYLDFMRFMSGGEMSPSFASSSRTKRSFGVNIKHAEGVALVKQLVAEADVVIENNSTGTMQKLGLGYHDLRAVNPDIVYVSSQLFGSRGVRSNWAGYGPSAQAYGGLTYLWRAPGDAPSANMANHPDLLAGHLCALAALAGLHARCATGRGAHAELAQVEIVVGLLGDLVMADALTPGAAGPDGNEDRRGAPWGVYRCEGVEAWCVICVRDDRDWQGLRRAMGDPSWAAQSRWEHAAQRCAGRAELDALVGAWTAARLPAEVAHACQAEGVPAGPMLYASELLTDGHLAQRGFLAPVDQPGCGPLVLEGAAFRGSDLAPPHIVAAPDLGQHTREIALDVLGLDDDQIDRLIESGTLEV